MSKISDVSLCTLNALMSTTQELLSLDVLLENSDEEYGFDIVYSSPVIEELFQSTDLEEMVHKVLQQLTEKERNIILLRFGMINCREHTLEEVGAMYGVTRERVRQIEVKVLRKLRHPTRQRFLKDFI
ncbi:hypothetical protein FACS1894188_02390 [Clostridia bacterium]|nr:hypothetical protein FACS1894188_02390 [Clostridia bacterium]